MRMRRHEGVTGSLDGMMIGWARTGSFAGDRPMLAVDMAAIVPCFVV